jgi:hypothetical protein
LRKCQVVGTSRSIKKIQKTLNEARKNLRGVGNVKTTLKDVGKILGSVGKTPKN